MPIIKKIALSLENISRYGGGAESYAVALAERLIQSGWEVHFFGERWDGEPVGAVFHEITTPHFLPDWMQLLIFALKHKKMVERQDFDVVLGFGNTITMNVYQSHGGVHWLTTYRKVYSAGNPVIRFVKRLLVHLSIKHYVRHWIESAPFRMARLPRIIAISKMVREDYVSYYDVKPEMIDLVYNGVDPKRFSAEGNCEDRAMIRNELGIPDTDVLFLFASYELNKKGIIPLIQALAHLQAQRHSDFRLVVAGGLPSKRINSLVDKLGIGPLIHFLGPRKDINRIFAACDVLVLPTYYDACSLVVFEAMMGGLPVITTKYNGAAGVITNGIDGFVVSHPPAFVEISSRMAQLLDNEFRARMSALAVQKGHEYTLARNHDQMIQIFDEVAAGNGGHAEAVRH